METMEVASGFTEEEKRFFKEIVTARVRRGAAFLSCRYTDWLERVNVSMLDMRSPEDSLVGQLFGSVAAATESARHLMGQYADLQRMGLSPCPSDPDPFCDMLTDAWREYILQNR